MSNILDGDNQRFTQEVTREFFKKVYSYMFAALAISGIIAYATGTQEFYFQYFVNVDQFGGQSISPLFYVVAFAPIGLGLLIQFAYRRLSYGLLLALFLIYSALMGLSLSSVMLVYSGQDIAITFFVAAGAFGGMAVLGYTTKVDLTQFGSLMYMAFIGIFIAVIGVFVFTGLTAYYMQMLKTASTDYSLSGIEREKLSLVGGLMLYILFINLFLSLLRILGSND
jgi:FtsH-binding integral membrane protein